MSVSQLLQRALTALCLTAALAVGVAPSSVAHAQTRAGARDQRVGARDQRVAVDSTRLLPFRLAPGAYIVGDVTSEQGARVEGPCTVQALEGYEFIPSEGGSAIMARKNSGTTTGTFTCNCSDGSGVCTIHVTNNSILCISEGCSGCSLGVVFRPSVASRGVD